MYFGSTFMSYGINMDFIKKIENTKFSELNRFYGVQWHIWSEKLHLLDLLMKCERWGECWLNHSETWAKQLLLMPFWTKLYFSWPHMVIIHSMVDQMCYQVNPVYSISSWTKLHLTGLETVFLVHLKKDQRHIFHMWPSRRFLFQY